MQSIRLKAARNQVGRRPVANQAMRRATMVNEQIQEGFGVFSGNGEKAFGAVRQVQTSPTPHLVVYVENAGDFIVGPEAIVSVHLQKVTVDPSKLDLKLRTAIGHAHDAEDPAI
jgi:hypothetical protein